VGLDWVGEQRRADITLLLLVTAAFVLVGVGLLIAAVYYDESRQRQTTRLVPAVNDRYLSDLQSELRLVLARAD